MGQNNWRLAKTHIWKRLRLSLRGKNIIRNQILISKLWYQRPDLYYSKILKRKLKKEYAIYSGTGKNRASQTVRSILHLEGQARYFTVLDRHKIKLDKNKMDSKFIKSHQCSLERSHAVLTEINSEFWLIPRTFSTRIDPYRFTSQKIYKNTAPRPIHVHINL